MADRAQSAFDSTRLMQADMGALRGTDRKGAEEAESP
jgi:hypothetical protein